ncbi:hypothetical protein HYO65_gp206 [Tenacibaculum phage PTm1]|uniref:Uncharacterized protein n=2 Tax=Shirahamavirus PTm1 TaxID=2846435 RepID=A0A5S9HXF4_9CAUD|nr:hypothetical protein HYO65_gp206 [Tenacibaculum phage PTm1]BBI90598.1 hypothetical protein [Tenacibaculum phage PTm1]BBI90905.1 hypothetical protein [Tenacibaculum phage PTm5]
MNITKLQKEFTGIGSEVRGFKFKQVRESDLGYIYEVDSGTTKYFEVFKKKTVAVCLNFEQRIFSETDFKETYPKASEFGYTAWTYDKLQRAVEKLETFKKKSEK